ncbi:hypothetical protein [Streptomyces griseorubiginosus]|uniref:hypothetical protein n=1 Tax=Streptomyces griseorubiginosus TaxID=67304 RepID=UPI002E81DE5C|nr:hypothetical protein [Streptomyces griseorubiginosus]WUB45386.1 hypothetical protein OHN19_19340 [Streptomyces griseorubiginosus]WUB53904.1 hypothetical protein OG942_19340 [Streptomyces griseorubiginosus]
MNQHDLNEIAHRIASAAMEFAPGHRPTAAQAADAAAILRDMMQGASMHGVTTADFDGVAHFARLAIQLVQSRDASR